MHLGRSATAPEVIDHPSARRQGCRDGTVQSITLHLQIRIWEVLTMNNVLSMAMLMLFDDLSCQKTCSGLRATLSPVVHDVIWIFGGYDIDPVHESRIRCAREKETERETARGRPRPRLHRDSAPLTRAHFHAYRTFRRRDANVAKASRDVNPDAFISSLLLYQETIHFGPLWKQPRTTNLISAAVAKWI
jgi:hypothetical protein